MAITAIPTTQSQDLASLQLDRGIPADYVPRLQLLLRQINYRYEAPSTPNEEFLSSFHDWMHSTLKPASSWSGKKIQALEDLCSSIMARAYPFTDTEMKIVMSKLTAITVFIDDSVEDDDMYDQITRFSPKIYLGEPQPPGVLAMYQECMRELSSLHEGDAVLRGLAVTPWITFIDACLLEKRLMTVDSRLRASPLDMGYHRLSMHGHDVYSASNLSSVANRPEKHAHGDLEGEAVKFPHYLRSKTGVAEPYAAAIFKANKNQELPLTRYIKAMPDILFFIEVMNDLLSFHKEQLAGETSNLIHLRTQSLRSALPDHSNSSWSLSDTIGLLCDEVRDATHRIDMLLRLEENEMTAKVPRQSVEDTDMNLGIAKQWRGFRDGYISWHLESERYKLGFLRPGRFYERD